MKFSLENNLGPGVNQYFQPSYEIKNTLKTIKTHDFQCFRVKDSHGGTKISQ